MTKITEIQPKSMKDGCSKDYVKNFSKRMLKTQLFVGTFQEKRYVEPLNSYRDVVKVDSDEKQFIENILAVRKKLKLELIKELTWIGITGPDTVGAPVGYNLWVVLPIEVFGTYWFKVKTVEFLENEVRVKLDIVRPVRNEKAADVSEADKSQNFDLKSTVLDLSNSFTTGMTDFVKIYVTLTNIKSTVIFISLLIGTIIGGGVNILKYLMDYSLKFIKETSGFIKVCTPIIISCIELIRKTIYGLFALIVALIHGKRTPIQPVHGLYYGNSNNMVTYRDNRGRQMYYPREPRRALPYGDPYVNGRSSVTIEPIDD